MPKTNAEYCRDYRKKKREKKIKKTAKSSTERVHEFRARRKALLNVKNASSITHNDDFTVQNSQNDHKAMLAYYTARRESIMSEEEWSSEKSLKLIEEYKKRDVIWKRELYNRIIVSHMWEEIASELQSTSETCKRKMGYFRCIYYRQKAAIAAALKEGVPQDTTISSFQKPHGFCMYEALEFLNYNSDYRKQISVEKSATPKDDAGESFSSIIKHEVITEPPLTRKRNATTTTAYTPIMSKKHVASTDSEETTARTTTVSESEVQSSSSGDEIRHFLNFIGTKMNTYSRITKNAVEQEICKIMFKADKNFYESSGYNSETVDESWGDAFECAVKQEQESDSG